MLKIKSQPKNWQRVKLKDVAEKISSGGTPSRLHSEYFTSDRDGHLWIKSKELLDAAIEDTEEKITDDALSNSSAKYFPEHTVLIAMYGANVGQLGWLKKRATVNQAVCGLIIDESKANWRYVFYSLLQNRDNLIVQARGAAQQNLNQDLIKNFEISILEIEGQRMVGSTLGTYDDLIENNTRRIKILEEIAQAIYREWFVYFRFPSHKKVKMVDSGTDFEKIPEGWVVKKIGDVFDVKYGKNLPTSKIQIFGDYPVYGAGGVIGFYHEQNSDGKVALITCRGNGSGTVWRTRGLGFVTNNSFAVRPKEEYKHIDFATVYFALKNANVDSAISGSAQPQITIECLNFVNVLLPKKGLLKSFQDIVKPPFDLIDSLFVENQNLRQVRDLFLPKLVSGELEIKS